MYCYTRHSQRIALLIEVMVAILAAMVILAFFVTDTAIAASNPIDWPTPAEYANPNEMPPFYQCNAQDESECPAAYRYACQKQGKPAACDYYNQHYLKPNEASIEPAPAIVVTGMDAYGNIVNANAAAQKEQELAALEKLCEKGNDAACAEMTADSAEEDAVIQKCIEGDKATCKNLGLEVPDEKLMAACISGDKTSCAEAGFEPADSRLTQACAEGNLQACKDVGIDSENQRLSTACVKGDNAACAKAGISLEDRDKMMADAEQSYATTPHEKEDGACAMIMCMRGSDKPPHQCIAGVKNFFKIRKTHHGHYSADRTAKARKEHLEKNCGSGSKNDIQRIIAKFGGLPTNPFKFSTD